MTTKDRVIKFLAYLKIGQTKFEEKVGLSRGLINNIKGSLSTNTLKKISTSYPELNTNWLLTGEGEMLKKNADIYPIESDTQENPSIIGKIIPLFDASAAAGTSYGMDMVPAKQIGMINIGGFLGDSETAIRIYGNSMTPHYPPGCIVGTKRWNERFIEPGKVYVVETSENRFIKRLRYNGDKTAYRCLSDNTLKHESGSAAGEYCYPEFEIPIEDVIRLHRVVGVIKRNIL